MFKPNRLLYTLYTHFVCGYEINNKLFKYIYFDFLQNEYTYILQHANF